MSITEYIILAILVFIACTTIGAYISLIVVLNKTDRHVDGLFDMQYNKLLLNIEISDDDFRLIDQIITDELELFALRETELKGIPYIYYNEDIQQKAKKEILKNVLHKLSPIHYKKLEFIYNRDVLEDIIYEKIQTAVILFSAENNADFKETKDSHVV